MSVSKQMTLQEWFYVVAGVTAVAVALWKTNRLYAIRSWVRRDQAIARTWLFCTLIFLVGLVSSNQAYVWMGEWTGINNINWLVTYLFTSLCLYIIADSINIISHVKTPLFLHLAIAVVWALLIAIFFGGIANAPLATYHEEAKTMRELLFMEVAYGYIAGVCFYVISQIITLTTTSEAFYTRVRWGFSVFSPICAALFFAGRFVYVPLIYYFPETSNPVVHDIIRALFIMASVTWPVFYLPQRLFVLLGKPILYVTNLVTLYQLSYLQAEIDKVCPRIKRQHESWAKRMRYLDMYIYRAVIGILDGKQVLGAYLVPEYGEGDVLFVGNGRLLTNPDIDTNRRIYETLKDVDDTADYTVLVAQYRAIAKQYRKGRGA
jgi:hypothetical protein